MFTHQASREYAWIQVAPAAKHDWFPSERTLAPPRGVVSDLTQTGDLPALASNRISFVDALAELGVPGTNKPPEEELVQLLLEAAEIEHGLMLQYLYAAYSLKELIIQGTLRTIAIEEMGHFITVQNLLAACGAKPLVSYSQALDGSLPVSSPD